MAGLNPLAVSVTWGAGGSTKDRSLELAGIVQREHCVDTILHLTCTNMEKGLVDEALRVCDYCCSIAIRYEYLHRQPKTGGSKISLPCAAVSLCAAGWKHIIISI